MNDKELQDKWQAMAAQPSLWHNAFHLEMQMGLINDPNGLCWQDGKYQVFCQWNPTGCTHANKHWAYMETPDFVNYTLPRLALAPVNDFDKNGCYSGSARVRNGRMEIFYTANLKDEAGVRYPRQILAVKNPGGSFAKVRVLIDAVPAGYTAHFRDPYIFTHSGRSFMVLGAQRENLTGCAIIYEEQGENNWVLRGELKTRLQDFGYMWECPNMLTVDGHDIFLFCPQGLEPEGHKYNNLFQAGYLMGSFNPDTLEFNHGGFIELDGGFDYYAPQVLVHEGRNILIGWIGMPDRLAEYPTDREGWIHSLTMPRELHVQDGRLYQLPIKGLAALEGEATVAAGDCAEVSVPSRISLSVEVQEAWEGRLHFGDEVLAISYAKETQEVCIDRTGLQLGGQGKRYFRVQPEGDKLELELYLDHSILEVYAKDGQACATACYFPVNGCKTAKLELNGAKAAIAPMSGITFA